jgi:hypothetical protein
MNSLQPQSPWWLPVTGGFADSLEQVKSAWAKAIHAYRVFFWPLQAFALCGFIYVIAYVQIGTAQRGDWDLNVRLAQLGMTLFQAPFYLAFMVASCKAIQGVDPKKSMLMVWDIRALKYICWMLIPWLLTQTFSIIATTHPSAPNHAYHAHTHTVLFYFIDGIFLLGIFSLASWVFMTYVLAEPLIARAKLSPLQKSWSAAKGEFIGGMFTVIMLLVPFAIGFIKGPGGDRFITYWAFRALLAFYTVLFRLFLAAYSFELVPDETSQ